MFLWTFTRPRIAIPRKMNQAPNHLTAMIDISRTRFIVFAWPDQRWPVEVIQWMDLLTADVDDLQSDYRLSIKKKNLVCARNTGIRDALNSRERYERFIFIDRDVRPTQATNIFLELDADIKSCQMRHESERAWIRPNSFHEGLWSTSREVLEKMDPPWFHHSYNADHTDMTDCICGSFRKQALEKGFSVAHGGWADHDRDQSWC